MPLGCLYSFQSRDKVSRILLVDGSSFSGASPGRAHGDTFPELLQVPSSCSADFVLGGSLVDVKLLATAESFRSETRPTNTLLSPPASCSTVANPALSVPTGSRLRFLGISYHPVSLNIIIDGIYNAYLLLLMFSFDSIVFLSNITFFFLSRTIQRAYEWHIRDDLDSAFIHRHTHTHTTI